MDSIMSNEGIFFLREREIPTTYHQNPTCNSTTSAGTLVDVSIVERTIFKDALGEYITNPYGRTIRVTPCGQCRQSNHAVQEIPGRWVERGKCQGMDLEYFFPEVVSNAGSYNTARAACDACPVIDECLDYALRTKQTEGMWGGTTPRQRWQMRRDMNREDQN